MGSAPARAEGERLSLLSENVIIIVVVVVVAFVASGSALGAALPCPAQRCPAQPSPAQPSAALPCPALPCVVLSVRFRRPWLSAIQENQ